MPLLESPVTEAKIYFHSCESMHEVKEHSVKLMIGHGTYLRDDTPIKLYQKVYNKEGLRILRTDGLLVTFQTDGYVKGRVVARNHILLNLLESVGWQLLDCHVWERYKSNMFQVPYTQVLVFAPPAGTASRVKLNKHPEWRQGIWRFGKGNPKADNGFPIRLCETVLKSCTEKGDLIVDPFAGSGVMLAVASQLGRKAIGYEIDETLLSIHKNNGIRVIR